MLSPMIACIGFAMVALPPPPSGPKAMPEMVHEAEKDESMATEPPRAQVDRSTGLLSTDLDSAYLPDVVGGYVEVVAGSSSSTVSAEAQETLAEVATLMKERGGVDVWVTSVLTSDSPEEVREAALAVESVTRQLKALGVENVPYRIWHPDEERPAAPMNTIEVRVLPSVIRPVS
jgi:hypothetical protein